MHRTIQNEIMSDHDRLLKYFERMESERQELLRNLSGYSDELLSQKPTADQWSVAEVIDHLATSETGAMNYMRKKIEYGGHGPSALTAGLKQRLLNLAISLPIRYRVPKILERKETSAIGYRETLDRWNAIRSAMRTEYSELDPAIVGNGLFKHPSAGKLNLIQGVRFMRRHMNRHIGQIHRTIRSLS